MGSVWFLRGLKRHAGFVSGVKVRLGYGFFGCQASPNASIFDCGSTLEISCFRMMNPFAFLNGTLLAAPAAKAVEDWPRSLEYIQQNRWRALLTLLYWLGTGACNIIGVRSLPEASNRAGTISIIHLIPLLFSDRLSFAADLLGLPLHSYLNLHGAMGFMTFVQGAIHILLFLLRNPLRTGNTVQFYGLLVRSFTPLNLYHWQKTGRHSSDCYDTS